MEIIRKLKHNKKIKEEELIELIKQNESDNLEFKQNIKRVREITETLSGFANNKGGLVVVGIDDKKQGNKKIVGANIGYQDIENIVTVSHDRTEPKLYPIIKSFKVLGKDIVLIYIEESSNKPVSAFRRFFKVSAASAKRDLMGLVRLGKTKEVGKGRNLKYVAKLDYDPISQKMTRLMTRKDEDKNAI